MLCIMICLQATADWLTVSEHFGVKVFDRLLPAGHRIRFAEHHIANIMQAMQPLYSCTCVQLL
jgi:predicted ester cyclase